ncbi:urease accessory protein UreF [Planktotalea sp.]|uniref:urease accessory protein UreF n=1 Tax=Planktotalea sp. TaxID=2029877 RepID=UPI003297A068
MDEPTAMPTELDVLTLTQWFSPSFPIGGFAYSHGLEWAIETGDVHDARSAQTWIANVLQNGAGWNDCLFIAAAYKSEGSADIRLLDAKCRAFAASRERLKETDLQGEAFCAVISDVWARDLRGLSYPVAVGRAVKLQDLPLGTATLMYLHSFLSNLAAVAMRLVPLGQTEGQRLINDLKPMLVDIARTAVDGDLDDLNSTSFLADVASMKHETQYSRIFRT